MKNQPPNRTPSRVAPKKSYGQNFLVSPAICRRIVNSCELEKTDTVVEIGPGKGILSRELAERVDRLILVEKDPRLISYLENEFGNGPVEIVHSDILKFALPQNQGKVVLVGNIPYNISTPIIEYAIANRHLIKSFFLTVQYEFGQRLAASPGSKAYGSLSIFCQYHADVKVVFKIKNTAFFPIPRVQSCFVRIDFRQPHFRLKEEIKFFRFVQQTFGQRRKTLLNALPVHLTKEETRSTLELLGIPPNTRAENLPLKDFVALYREFGEGGEPNRSNRETND